MNRTTSSPRRSIRRLAAGLGTLAMTLGAVALGITGALPAQAATTRAAAPAITPAAIPLNTLNWSGSAGFGSRAPAWYKDASGVIHLQGAATQVNNTGPGANLLGTLPKAARPASDVYTIVHTFNGTYADLAIETSGQIDLIAPRSPAVQDYSFVSLESITYRPSLAGSAITVNTLNWSGSAGFGSRAPAWYKDASGVIHLRGAATQVNNTGPGANLLGTLPKAARPHNSLFFIVHAFNGTYADLAVQANGQIDLIAPRPPAVQDYSFVSLEGISYRPKSTAKTILDINGVNWSPFARFDSRVPAWFKDSSGVIHLQGAATQTSTSGAGANLIATLPPAARPASDVYTVVHTFNGTYADLVIQTNGQIDVINPRPPAVQDYTFVSLEGITYLR